MEKAIKRGDRWRVRAQVNGVRKSFTADTKREAERLAAEWEGSSKASISLRKAVEDYIDSKSNLLSPATLRGYRTILERYFSDTFLETRVDRLTDLIIQREINEISKGHSPKTCRNAKGLLTAALRMFRPDYHPYVTLPPKERVEKKIPNEEEVSAMLMAAAGTPVEVPIILAAFGSLRRSEICALMPDCIYPDHVTVRRAMVPNDQKEYVIKDHPKTYAGYRDVYLPPNAMEKVRAWANGKPAGVPIYGGTPDSLDRRFRTIQAHAGVGTYGIHALRHYFASFCHASGIPDQYIMKMGGWDDINTLTKIYQHTMASKEADVLQRITDHYNALQRETQRAPQERS